MKRTIVLTLIFLISLQTFSQKVKKNISYKKEIKIPMKADKWDFKPDKVLFEDYKSVPTMKILPEAGQVVLKDFNFKDGTIEFDIDTQDSRFSSFYFRRHDEKETELFYLRNRIENPLAMDAVQYAPIVKGVNLWDILEYDQGPAFVKSKDWNHIKLVISGKQMLVYVNSLSKPTLQIQRLEGNSNEGTLAFEGQIFISNLIIKPDLTEGLSASEGFDPTYNDSRYLTKWLVSEPSSFPLGRDLIIKDFPTDQIKWEAIEAERRGLINLSRIFGESKERRIAWLKVKLKVETDQKHKIDFGFSDEVWVYMNGKMVYVDKNLYGHPIMKEPNGRCSVDNSSFILPFKAGTNELLIGLSNNFYGWGIIAKLDTMEGITIEK